MTEKGTGTEAPAQRPAPEGISVKEKAPRDRRFFKAVCNYMANGLKLDRDAVRGIVEKKVESMGVEALVERCVTKYFGFGPDAHSAEDWTRARIGKAVDRYVEQKLASGMGSWLDRTIQAHMDQIAGSTGTGTVPVRRRPGLESWKGALLLDSRLVNACVGEWLLANIDGNGSLSFCLDLESGDGPCVKLEHLDDGSMGALNALRKAPGRYATFLGEASIDAYMLSRLLETQLGLPSGAIGRITAVPGGLAAFLVCGLESAQGPVKPAEEWSIVEHWYVVELRTENGIRYLGRSRAGEAPVEDAGNASRYRQWATALEQSEKAGRKFRCGAVPKKLTVGWNISGAADTDGHTTDARAGIDSVQ